MTSPSLLLPLSPQFRALCGAHGNGTCHPPQACPALLSDFACPMPGDGADLQSTQPSGTPPSYLF